MSLFTVPLVTVLVIYIIFDYTCTIRELGNRTIFLNSFYQCSFMVFLLSANMEYIKIPI